MMYNQDWLLRQIHLLIERAVSGATDAQSEADLLSQLGLSAATIDQLPVSTLLGFLTTDAGLDLRRALVLALVSRGPRRATVVRAILAHPDDELRQTGASRDFLENLIQVKH